MYFQIFVSHIHTLLYIFRYTHTRHRHIPRPSKKYLVPCRYSGHVQKDPHRSQKVSSASTACAWVCIQKPMKLPYTELCHWSFSLTEIRCVGRGPDTTLPSQASCGQPSVMSWRLEGMFRPLIAAWACCLHAFLCAWEEKKGFVEPYEQLPPLWKGIVSAQRRIIT